MLLALLATALLQDPFTPVGPVPSARQLAWQKNEYYAFVHFGPNSFTGKEWGTGKEPTDVFNPTHLDCLQWCKAFKAAGMTGVIMTAKHHDGFCLWPSKFSTHTVAQSPWKGGKGDVLKELSDACHKTGLNFGVYLSPWDRNHPAYGTPEYNQVFMNMLGEVLTKYGKVFEVWFDGANGEGPNGKRMVYDWPGFNGTVRKFQPGAVIFSDAGPDIRWVGNEEGFAGETNWSTINRSRYHPGTDLYKELTEGDEHGIDWVPAECDVSIRPGWFYKSSEDDKVRTPDNLMDLYEKSVGRNSSLLLNVPAGPDGQIHQADVNALMAFKDLREATYGQNLLPLGQGMFVNGMEIPIKLKQPVRFDRVALGEPIKFGQRVAEFTFEAKVQDKWMVLAKGTTIGNRRLLHVPLITASELRIKVSRSKGAVLLSHVGLYLSPSGRTQ